MAENLVSGSSGSLRQICSRWLMEYVSKVSLLEVKWSMRYACSKFAFTAVCYSATLWPFDVRFTPQPLGMTLYQCAKFQFDLTVLWAARLRWQKKEQIRQDVNNKRFRTLRDKNLWVAQTEMFTNKFMYLSSIHITLSHVWGLSSSLWLVLPCKLPTGDKMKSKATLNKMTDF